MDIEQALIDLDLHDKSFEDIFISLDEELIVFTLRSYNDDLQDYYTSKLEFSGINSLQVDNLIDLSKTEIITFDLEVKNNLYYLKLIMLQGYAQPEWEIQFSFKELVIK